MALKLITDVADECIDIDTARRHCRITPEGSPPSHPDDALLTDIYIPAARQWVEFYTGKLYAPRIYDLVLDEFPVGGITFPVQPVTAVSSITYVDEDGAEQDFDVANWTFDEFADPPAVRLVADAQWPTIDDVPNAVRVRFEVGATDQAASPSPAPLPKVVKAAMLLVLTHLYENRSMATDQALNLLPQGPKALLSDERIRRGWA